MDLRLSLAEGLSLAEVRGRGVALYHSLHVVYDSHYGIYSELLIARLPHNTAGHIPDCVL